MDLGLTGRTAVVCASTGGLGAAVARALGQEGAQVVVSGRRESEAKALAASLPSSIGVGVDLLADDGPETLLEAATAAYGTVDIMVLNGPGPAPAPAHTMAWADAQTAVDMLLRPQLTLVGATLPGMRDRSWGRILAVGSSGVVSPLPNLAGSNLGRAALAGYLKTLAGEVAADGVTVNMLLPGRLATDRVAAIDEGNAARQGRTIEEVRAASVATIPAGRYGDADEFGAVAAFFCSERASYITGTALRCDGGLVRSL